MTFVDTLMSFLSGAFEVIGKGIQTLLNFLAVPLGWLVALIEGIWYFLTKLVTVVIEVIDIFIALFQFLGSLALGFLRTIQALLFIDFSRTPLNYPSSTGSGMQLVMEKVLQPVGFMTVVPSVVLALVWLFFVVRVIGLLGGERDNA
ncbi:hypothetical protein [Paenibacillus sp. 7516]|uniref:hypothetical protein n=1 Tax=Paenibacillus sp. 7516 TaxID=2022549 RepID=UPI000BA518F2|nr:hypothetical protein [Paenibacillus sp. 7516]PAF30774.1 hypothetical protein CHI14_15930 [Paenibacillus sp. 7516]